MTPKEKAQELVNKMCNIEERFGSVGIYEGKECALIAVDEILSVIWINLDDEVDYWAEVKQEIEKL